ncbi:MAG: right-handed parallel beta-helix repeat-containing protein [Leptospiraceae bacterium]|nr:right-handed parallel beta-helix repeat-containing protein [Leptospiraceae bacterium]MCK6379888.1 right-handed parallel beta-helix repeat-containing protein [Leptospiraceae bacterium]NUM40231.1 right-handed parallel beta-helix repeat-containing protein [Leptospiraceae bacterium]
MKYSIILIILLFNLTKCNVKLPEVDSSPELLAIFNCVTNQSHCNIGFLVGGTVSGLVSGELVVSLNEKSDLSIYGGQTNFTFLMGLMLGQSYTVTVKSQPTGYSCSIANGSGTIGGNVHTVQISCVVANINYLYSNGLNWNDYIKNDGTNIANASNTACLGTETQYRGCIPAFLYRVFEITGKTSCTNISIVDNLTLLNWACVVSPNGSVYALSTGLRDGKGLSDTIDFTNLQFKNITVAVYDGQTTYMQTKERVFWGNEIGTVSPLCVPTTSGEGVIYAISSNVTCSSTVTLGNSKVGIVTNPSTKTKIISTANTGIIDTNSKNFVWLEVTLDGSAITAASQGINLFQSNYSKVHNSRIANMIFAGSVGLKIQNSNNNIVQNLFTGNNELAGLQISGTSSNNLILGLSSYNNRRGIDSNGFSVSSNIFLYNTIMNTTEAGIDLSGAAQTKKNNVFISVTVANSFTNGINLGGTASGGNLLMDIVLANNQTNGLLISDNLSSTLGTHTFNHTAYIGNGAAVSMNSTGNSRYYFTGLFKNTLASTCTNTTNTSGPTTGTCSPAVAPSNFTYQPISSPYGIFNGKSTDSINSSADGTGQAIYNISNDWYFLNSMTKGWGIAHANPFPDTGHRGKCTAGNCQIFALSLSKINSEIRNVLTCPDGNFTQTHFWHATGQTDDASCNLVFPGAKYYGPLDCRTTFLANAIELINDGTGNDNGLCESNENCLYSPNIGAYQGHGTIQSASNVSGCSDIGTGTAITNVKLFQYVGNGY